MVNFDLTAWNCWCVAIEVVIGISLARAWSAMVMGWLDVEPLPLMLWLPAYLVQDFVFHQTHSGAHGIGLLANTSLIHFLLPGHKNHHGPQSLRAMFYYFFIETTPLTIFCAACAYLALGPRGAVSSVLQNTGSQHIIHWIHHTPFYTKNHHMRHHEFRVVNFCGENVLYDILQESYEGQVLFTWGPKITSTTRANRKKAAAADETPK
jgi:hypothetical protein